MGVKVKADFTGLDIFSTRLKAVDGLKSRVGIIGQEALEMRRDPETGEDVITMGLLAVVQEYGRPRKGKQPPIPARPALGRVALGEVPAIRRAYIDGIAPYLRAVKRRATQGEAAQEAIAPAAGFVARLVRYSYDTSKGWAKRNAPKTIKKKGFNFPLTETGKLKNSVSFQVVDRTGNVRAQGKG